MISLVVKLADGKEFEESFQFDQGMIDIGRSVMNDIVLPDASRSISRKHAQIVFQEGRYFLRDLKSRNKTFLNRAVVLPNKSYPLEALDEVIIHGYSIRITSLHVEPQPLPIPPSQSFAFFGDSLGKQANEVFPEINVQPDTFEQREEDPTEFQPDEQHELDEVIDSYISENDFFTLPEIPSDLKEHSNATDSTKQTASAPPTTQMHPNIFMQDAEALAALLQRLQETYDSSSPDERSFELMVALYENVRSFKDKKIGMALFSALKS